MATRLTLGDGVGVLDLQVRQNQRFAPLVTLSTPGATAADPSVPVNLDGCSVKCMVKKVATDVVALLTMQASDTSLTISDAATGSIRFNGDFSKVPPGTYVYDLVITKPGTIPWNILAGNIVVAGGVTR